MCVVCKRAIWQQQVLCKPRMSVAFQKSLISAIASFRTGEYQRAALAVPLVPTIAKERTQLQELHGTVLLQSQFMSCKIALATVFACKSL